MGGRAGEAGVKDQSHQLPLPLVTVTRFCGVSSAGRLLTGAPVARAQPVARAGAGNHGASAGTETQGRPGTRHPLRRRGRRGRPDLLLSACSQRGSPRKEPLTHLVFPQVSDGKRTTPAFGEAAGQAGWMRVFVSDPRAREREPMNSSDSSSEATPLGSLGGGVGGPQGPWPPYRGRCRPTPGNGEHRVPSACELPPRKQTCRVRRRRGRASEYLCHLEAGPRGVAPGEAVVPRASLCPRERDRPPLLSRF